MREGEHHPLSIRAVERALDILRAFGSDNSEHSLGEISGKVGLSKSTVFRMMVTLEGKGFVQQDRNTLRYRLGPEILRMATVASGRLHLMNLASDGIRNLAAKCQETIIVCVEEKEKRVVLCSQVGKLRPPAHYVKGGSSSLHEAAEGKVLLAFREEHLIRDYLLRHRLFSMATQLFSDLAEIRKKGFSLTREDQLRTFCLASPICNHLGRAIASIGVYGSTVRLTEPYLADLEQMIKSVAEDMANQIGC